MAFVTILYKNPHSYPQMLGLFIRVRVLGTDYGSSWVRELTWALFPGEELFAPAPAETMRSDDLDDVDMILI